MWASAGVLAVVACVGSAQEIGSEKAVNTHLSDHDLTRLTISEILRHGSKLFGANWTSEDGAGRPLMKGTTRMLSDMSRPLVGDRAFNRLSGPDANSCVGCHNAPFGISGGGGDFVTNVFALGQRFDFLNFDPKDRRPVVGAADEKGRPISLDSAANLRATTGMFGAGYLEMLAREITSELQKIRNNIKPGETRRLVAKGIDFGELTRGTDGLWDTSKVVGLPRQSTDAPTPVDAPNLIVRPWHQSANVVSLREFSNNAFHQHHGVQSVERFGLDTDPDGDGYKNEMTRGDITAVALYQAAMAVPGRVIPRNAAIEGAVLRGEKIFESIGCASCHIPELPLTEPYWTYSEPGPYNPTTNVRRGELVEVRLNLNDSSLPQPRLEPDKFRSDLLYVPAYTDMKLHDISSPEDPTPEPLDQNETVWSPKFGNGNRRFLTKRLWGCANEPPYYHHGLFTTLRQSIVAHDGEARPTKKAFQALADSDQRALIEFLKTLQVLPPNTPHRIVDENYKPREWPPAIQTQRAPGTAQTASNTTY